MPISGLGGFSQGVSEGLRNLSTIQGMKNSQSQQERSAVLAKQQDEEHGLRMWGLERAKEAVLKEDAAKKEISEYVMANRDKIKSMSDNLAAIGDVTEPKPFVPVAGNGWENTAGKSIFDTSKRAYEAKIKAKETIQDEMAKITGDLTKKQYDTYLKYGLTDQAEKVQKEHFTHAKDVATVLGPQAALTLLRNGVGGESFKDVKVQDKGDHFEFKNYGGGSTNQDGIMVMDKRTGTVKIVQPPTPKEEESKVVGAGGTLVKDGKIIYSNPKHGDGFAPSDTEKKFNFWKSLYPNLSNDEIEKKIIKEDIPSETRFVLDMLKESKRNMDTPEEQAAVEKSAREQYRRLTGAKNILPQPGQDEDSSSGISPYNPEQIKADMERRGFVQRADGKWEKPEVKPATQNNTTAQPAVAKSRALVLETRPAGISPRAWKAKTLLQKEAYLSDLRKKRKMKYRELQGIKDK